MLLNFKEIPKANTGNGDQDTFELFARDFLEVLGYKIIQQPDRGADGKKDMIIQEIRHGISGITKIKWLVSCKHYYSGKSVSDTEEPNILDRVTTHDCDGFLSFYSTIPSTSLNKNFEGLKKKIEIESFDRERIEKTLLDSPDGLMLANRYFPDSFKNYHLENPKPAKIFSGDGSICCEYCNTNLLESKSGIFVMLRESKDWESGIHNPKYYVKSYFSCKGECDYILKNRYMQEKILIDEWIDITDYLSPTTYIKKQMAWMNDIVKDGDTFSDEVFEKVKELFIKTFPYICRESTTKEKENLKFYLQNGLLEWL